MADRLSQVAGHLSGNYNRGLLNGEVAIITGEYHEVLQSA
jgi:3-oxoacyl-[acyl-carrier protein] reductase